jgi:argininosuccinate synthase
MGTKLIDFAEKHQITITKDKRGEAPFSVDANLLHTSSEGKLLEDPSIECPEDVHQVLSQEKQFFDKHPPDIL